MLAGWRRRQNLIYPAASQLLIVGFFMVEHTPQIEDGYLKLANEIQRHLCKFRIPGEQRQVLDAIILQTYGWNKKEEKISMSYIAELTGLKRPNVARALASLIEKKIVIKTDNSYINSWRLNKNIKEWKVLSKVIPPSKSVIKSDTTPLSKVITPVIKSDNKTVIKSDNHKIHKDTIIKDTNIKGEAEPLEKDDNYFIGLFKKVNPNYTMLYKNTTQRKAVQAMRANIEIGDETLEKVILSLEKSNTWDYFPVITTPYQLQVDWGKLKSQYERKFRNGANKQNSGKPSGVLTFS